jgi:hypothetical protein
MAFSGINYHETYFEFPELTKVCGEPTSESLFKLRNELKANAKSVYSNLSDGDHGHLALVLSDAQCALLTALPFIRPIFPGALVVPPNTSGRGPMATVMKEAHQERIQLFREVQGVEKALMQQIVQAVEAPYPSSIRDRDSNSFRGTVHDILTCLQEVYGRVSPQMLEDRDNDLRSMVYKPQQPIDVVFNAVEDYMGRNRGAVEISEAKSDEILEPEESRSNGGAAARSLETSIVRTARNVPESSN